MAGIVDRRPKYSIWILVAAFLIFFPGFASEYYVHLLTKIFIMALLAISFNLLLGYAGMLSFGQSAYFSIGAYACSLYLKNVSSSSLFLPLLAAVILSGIAALIIGFFCVKLTRVYFALLTLAFSQLIYAVIHKWYSFTGGDNGLVGIPVPPIKFIGLTINLVETNNYYYFALALFFLILMACKILVNSPFGSTLRAIRENPGRTEYLGIKVKNFQLMIFVFAGMVGGFAGGLIGPFERSIFPDLAYWTTSGEAAFMSILGGIYTFVGPVVGAVILIFLQDVIRSHTEYWPIFVGGILMFMVIFLPGGVMGFIETKFSGTGERRKSKP